MSCIYFLPRFRGDFFKTAAISCQKRYLNLHEYQSMQLMEKFGIRVPKFAAAQTPIEAKSAAAKLLADIQTSTDHTNNLGAIIKAQVLAGGRGLGYFKENGFKGGVQRCATAEEIEYIASQMLNHTLITKQTGETGKPCNTVLICEEFKIKRERYLAILLDRAAGGPIIIGSARGGTSIEDIAEQFPDSIVKMPVDIRKGVLDCAALEKFIDGMDLKEDSQREEMRKLIKSLFSMFQAKDCLLVEINPLVETEEGHLQVCDAKINFDDNAAFRQKELFSLRDKTQENEGEVIAEKYNLNYIKLNGNIGCMVNGAGLAMATMDLIKIKGGEPANFLDVGGGANKEQIIQALDIIQKDQDAQAVLINIFGGIMRCDIIAEGLVAAIKEIGFTKPLVVRLEGTNKEAAETILAEASKTKDFSGIKMHSCNDFDKAAELVVKMVKSL